MRRVFHALLACLALSATAPAQSSCPINYATVTGLKIGATTPLAAGQLTVIAQDASGNPINYSVPGVGVELTTPKLDPIIAGILVNQLCLPRTDRTSIPVSYHFIIRDTSATGGRRVVLDASAVPVTVDNFSLDSYNFANTNAAVLQKTTYAGMAALPQTPTGAIDSVNVTFALNDTPTSGQLYLNGLIQQLGIDYTLSGSTLTLGVPPQPGDTLIWITTNVNVATTTNPGTGTGGSSSGPVSILAFTDQQNQRTYAIKFSGGAMKIGPYTLPSGASAAPTSRNVTGDNGKTYTLAFNRGSLVRTP